MLYDSGPMQGVTSWVWRTAHSRYFAPADRYYTPFLTPTYTHTFGPKELAEVLPEHNAGFTLVPQLLTNSAEDFLWAAGALAQLGYTQVNLNLGCPSGTVTAKYKGSGLLRRGDELDALLGAIFEKTPVPVSVKTRLGWEDAAEFPALLEIYRRYPLSELIVHARVRQAQYRGRADYAAFAAALEDAPWPVCANGDLFTAQAVSDFAARFPGAGRVMLGRGLAADPGLIGRCRGTGAPTREALSGFHDTVYDLYAAHSQGGEAPTLRRMKELWSYLLCLFDGTERAARDLRKAQSAEAYRAAAEEILRHCPLREAAQGVR